MTASTIAANVIFSAGWVAVGAAALYSRHRRAAREAGAERTTAAPAEAQPAAEPRRPQLEATWAGDLSALATAIENATAAPELEHDYKPARVGHSQ